MSRDAFTVPETADRLGISVHSVRRAIARGDLPAFRLGHRVLIPAEAVRALTGVTP